MENNFIMGIGLCVRVLKIFWNQIKLKLIKGDVCKTL